MKAKSLLCLVLALALVVSLAACGGSKKKKTDDSSSSSSSMPDVVSQAPTPEPMAKAVRVNADDGLNVREAPSTDSEILGLAAKNSKLPLLKDTEVDGWYQIEYKGETAYVFAEYATMIEVTQTEYNSLRSGSDHTATPAPDATPDAGTDNGDTSDPSGSDSGDDPASSADPDETPAPAGLNNQDGE